MVYFDIAYCIRFSATNRISDIQIVNCMALFLNFFRCDEILNFPLVYNFDETATPLVF